MAVAQYQISRDAADMLREFDDSFREALVLGDITPWAQDFGFVRTTPAPKTTFPIPLHALKYQEFKGDIKYQSLYFRSLSMVGKEWTAGVEEKANVIEAPDFVDWAGAPAILAQEWARLPNEIVANLLATSSFAGPLLDFYRDPDTGTASSRRMFATDHPYNVLDTALGTFDNTMTCTVAEIEDGSIYDSIDLRFRGIKGPNGKPLGLQFLNGGRILSSSTRVPTHNKVLKCDTLIRAVQNAAGTDTVAAVTQANTFYKGIALTDAVELTSEDYFYAFAAQKPGLHAWVLQTKGAPEERRFDKDTEFYRETNRVKIGYIGEMNASMCLPHGVIRVQITG